MEIYVDGQHTKTQSVICVVITPNGRNNMVGNKELKVIDYLKNSSDVEKMALLTGLKYAIYHSGKKNICPVISDSVQAVSSYYLDESFKDIRNEVINSGKKIKVCWMPREQNVAGKYLEVRLEKVNYNIKNVTNTKIGIKEKKFLRKLNSLKETNE